jgi:hypothetical protein
MSQNLVNKHPSKHETRNSAQIQPPLRFVLPPHTPRVIPCHQRTFIRRTSGDCLGTFTAVNVLVLPGHKLQSKCVCVCVCVCATVRDRNQRHDDAPNPSMLNKVHFWTSSNTVYFIRELYCCWKNTRKQLQPVAACYNSWEKVQTQPLRK